MSKDNTYAAIKATLLADIAKGCDDSIADRTRTLLEGWEACRAEPVARSAEPEQEQIRSYFSTNADVKRLARVNAIALLSMAAVSITSLVVRK